MKKEIPILMSTMMVQAILAGRKAMTRRLKGLEEINEDPDNWEFDRFEENIKGGLNAVFKPKGGFNLDLDFNLSIPCPYGRPGDLLWVKESYYQYGQWKYGDKLTKVKKRVKMVFTPIGEEIAFSDTETVMGETFRLEVQPNTYRLPAWFKRLGRFMPRKYARIWLEVTDIRVERLQDISPHDAADEGVEYWNIDWEALEGGELQADYKNYTWRDDPAYEDYHFPTFANPVDSFRTLWQFINGQDSWQANPWVWVISFRVLSTTGKPASLEKEVAV